MAVVTAGKLPKTVTLASRGFNSHRPPHFPTGKVPTQTSARHNREAAEGEGAGRSKVPEKLIRTQSSGLCGKSLAVNFSGV